MCVPVNKYKTLVNNIKHQTYPSTLRFLSNINPDTEPCLKAVNELTNEITSLENIENKLIFPSTLSLLEQTKGEAYSPNVEQIIKLTHQKQDKIKVLFDNLFYEMNICSGCSEINLSAELKIVEQSFFKSKEQWLSVLHFLTTDEAKCKNRVNGSCVCDTKVKKVND